jgi:hypothetical protein
MPAPGQPVHRGGKLPQGRSIYAAKLAKKLPGNNLSRQLGGLSMNLSPAIFIKTIEI